MSNWVWLAIILVVLFFVYGWYADRRSMQKQAKWAAEAEEYSTREGTVIQRQIEFEERLHQGVESSLPDAVRGKALHIYRHLMREWFSKLAAQTRYDEPKLKKLRKDWLIYMHALEMSRLHSFLSAESSNETKREQYERDEYEERVQIAAIEDAFAEAVGPEAVETLRQIRLMEWDSFSEAGQLAPDGHYFPGWPYGELSWPRGKPLPPPPPRPNAASR